MWETAGGVQSAYRPAAGPWAGPTPVSPAGDVAVDPDVAMARPAWCWPSWRHDLNRAGDPGTAESSIRRGTGAWSGGFVRTRAATSSVPSLSASRGPFVLGRRPRRDVASPDRRARHPLEARGTGGDFGGWGGSPLFQAIGVGATDAEVPQLAGSPSTAAPRGLAQLDAVRGFRTQGATIGINGAWTPPAILADAETGHAERQARRALRPACRRSGPWSQGASRRDPPAGGGFQPAATISTPGSTGAADPRVVMTDADDAVGTWSEADTGVARIAVAVDDVTPPALSAVTVPATATTGASVAMSAAASDTWSPVTISWTLGDGTAIAGAAVSHAYAMPGRGPSR